MGSQNSKCVPAFTQTLPKQRKSDNTNSPLHYWIHKASRSRPTPEPELKRKRKKSENTPPQDDLDPRVKAICLGIFCLAAGAGLTVPAFPVLAASIGVTPFQLGMTNAALCIAKLAADLPAGIISDKIGRRPFLIVAPCLTGVAFLGTGMSAGLYTYLMWRLMSGLTDTCQWTGLQMYLKDISTDKTRARSFSVLGTGFNLGMAFSPLLGGWLLDHYGLHTPYLGSLLLCSSLGVVAYYMLPETVDVKAARAKPSDTSWSSFYKACKPVLKNRDFTRALVLNSVITGAFAGVQFYMIPLCMTSLGYSGTAVGALFCGLSLCGAASFPFAGKLADTQGRKSVIVPASLLAATCCAALAQASSPIAFAAAATVTSVGLQMALAGIQPYVIDVTNPDEHTNALSLVRVTQNVGQAATQVLLAACVATHGMPSAILGESIVLGAAALYFAVKAPESLKVEVLDAGED